jgi:hypothetical protein
MLPWVYASVDVFVGLRTSVDVDVGLRTSVEVLVGLRTSVRVGLLTSLRDGGWRMATPLTPVSRKPSKRLMAGHLIKRTGGELSRRKLVLFHDAENFLLTLRALSFTFEIVTMSNRSLATTFASRAKRLSGGCVRIAFMVILDSTHGSTLETQQPQSVEPNKWGFYRG